MKDFLKGFCDRGVKFAWGGPAVMAMVLLCIQAAGTEVNLTVNQAALGIMTTTVMAFIAAGISIVYQMESLPKAFAGLIQAAVLYIDYLGFYLLNGWISVNTVGMFTLIFVIGFAAIWFSIYIPIKRKVKKMNQLLNQQ